VSSPGPATEEAGSDAPAAATGPSTVSADSFGPNSAEVAAFVEAVGRLSASQWRKVVAARQLASSIIRDPSALPVDAVRALLSGTPNGSPIPEPVAALAAAFARPLEGRTDEEVLAAWQAAGALARRRQMQALTFAAHYLPFAGVIPPASMDAPAAAVARFTKALRWLDATQWQVLAAPWTLDRDASTALLQVAARSQTREGEEAAAFAALAAAPKHLPGDAGWAAVKTAVHGARVLACRAELSAEQLAALWAPLEAAIALRSLDDLPGPAHSPKRARAVPAPKAPAPAKKPAPKRGALYGPNSSDVAAFVKAVPTLTPIQWLRILDRRQLVARITRERSAEPAPVIRASLAAIAGTRELDAEARCRILSAVERAGYALESREQLSVEQAAQHYGSVAEVIPFAEVDAASFAARVAALNPEEWVSLAAGVAAVDVDAVRPLLNAGDALADLLAGRTDDEIAVTWHAMAALVQRHNLSPIKFAVSFAPFASLLVVVKPRSLSSLVQRYLTAVGRLSAHQCSLLAEPWLLADDVSTALAAAISGGAARAAEEAAALTALVTVPMRLTGDAGWAAAKTVAYGARVAASRDRVAEDQLSALWKPLERAIPLASLESKSKSRLP
jgi:hypothetical protein